MKSSDKDLPLYERSKPGRSLHRVEIQDFADWRDLCRSALQAGISPDFIDIRDARLPSTNMSTSHGLLFDEGWQSTETFVKDIKSSVGKKLSVDSTENFRIPAKFLGDLKRLSQFNSTETWNFLYRLVFRVKTEGMRYLSNPLDKDKQTVEKWKKELSRDSHKMKAFLRFRKKGEVYEARYKSRHFVLSGLQDFFVSRFSGMKFKIETPFESLCWDGKKETYQFQCSSWQGIEHDDMDELWGTYYQNTFNPARLNMKATLNEMPKHLWENMPETKLIPEMIANAKAKTENMLKEQDRVRMQTMACVQSSKNLAELNEIVSSCSLCPLACGYGEARKGQGVPNPELMVICDQPIGGSSGEEVLQHPMLQAVAESSITSYITFAVKHPYFNSDPETKKRTPRRVSKSFVRECKLYLQREIELLQPKILLLMGQAAKYSLFSTYPVSKTSQGRVLSSELYLPYGTVKVLFLEFDPIAKSYDTDMQDLTRELIDSVKSYKSPV